MIKFFRKIRLKLLTENQFRKYLIYAIGEIFLVVIGILIALQINNWNQEQKRHSEEQQILASLKTDLETSLKQLNRKINATSNIQKLDSTAFVLIKQESKFVDNDSLMKILTGYVGPPTFDPESGTIEQIKYSGKSNVISNLELRKFIGAWSSYMNEIKEIEYQFLEFYNKRKKPYLSKYLPYRNNQRHRFGLSDHEIDKSGIYSSLEFENIVHESWTNCRFLEFRYGRIKSKIIEMIAILESEIIE